MSEILHSWFRILRVFVAVEIVLVFLSVVMAAMNAGSDRPGDIGFRAEMKEYLFILAIKLPLLIMAGVSVIGFALWVGGAF